MFLALQAPTTTPGFLLLKCPMFTPLCLLRAMQFVPHLRWRHRRPNHVILAPVLCADQTVTPRKQRLPCLVHTLFVFCLFHCCLCVIFTFVWCNVHLRSMPSSAMQSHIILHVFSSNLSPHPCFFSPAAISSCIPQTTTCSSATYLTLLSLLPFDSAFCSTTQHLAYAFPSFLSAFQLQSLFHRAFSHSTALRGTSNELFQWRFG